MKNIIRITASLLTAALLTAAPLTAVQSGAFLAKMPGVEVTEDTTLHQLDDFFTDTLGEHILLTKTSDLFFPGAYGKEMVVLSSDGKLHLYYTELSEAAFTVADGFDKEALTAEMRRQDITAVINSDGDNRYIIKSAHDNSYTPGNYQRLVALLEDTDEVTLIEHSYTMTEDKANAAGDLAFLFRGDISADEIMRRYSLGLTENSTFGYPAGYCTLCLGLDSSDLEKDYKEIKRLTENEDCTFSCCITELAYEWDTLWHCREVIFDRSRNAIPEPELVPGVLGDANLDTKVTIADSVAILQHIACRDKYELKPQGLINADVDGVDGVTSSDARVIQAQDAFGVFNVQGRDFSSKVDYGSIIANNILKNGEVNGKTSRGCASVITDTDGLKAYLSEICSDKAIEAYEEEYNDKFFEENVLLIDAIAQGSGTFPRLVIKSVDINDIITVEAVWIPQILQEPIMSVCIGQVALSKKAYIGQEVVWTCNNKEVN